MCDFSRNNRTTTKLSKIPGSNPLGRMAILRIRWNDSKSESVRSWSALVKEEKEEEGEEKEDRVSSRI